MHALIVHCHPEPCSFNTALTEIAVEELRKQGHTIEVSDLYAEGFDPIEGPQHFPQRAVSNYFSALTEQRHASESSALPADVTREIDRLERAQLVIFQFPLWWHSTPAMLKGWLDRVFVYGGLYTGRMRYDRGYFRGRRAICSITTGAPTSVFTTKGRGGGHIEELLYPMLFSLHYMGYSVLPPFTAHGVQAGGVTYLTKSAFDKLLDAHKQQWVHRLAQLLTDEPIPFPGWTDWDEQGVPKSAY